MSKLLVGIVLGCAFSVVAAETCPCVKNDGMCEGVIPTGLSTCTTEQRPCGGCVCAMGGPDTCEIEAGTRWVLTGNGDECESEPSLTAICPEEEVCPNPVLSLYIDDVPHGCVEPIQTTQTIVDYYGYNDAKAENLNDLEYEYLNLRFVQSSADNQLYYCAIYGDWARGEELYPVDNDVGRAEKSEVTAGFPLEFVVEDDPRGQFGDSYSGDGTTTVMTEHQHLSNKTDGYCIGPLGSMEVGDSFKARYYDLENTRGVAVGSYLWKFVDNRAPGELSLTTGLTNGDDSVTVEFKTTCECAPTPTPTPEPAPLTGWVLSAIAQTCNDACGGPCSPEGIDQANSLGAAGLPTFLQNTFGVTCDDTSGITGSTQGPFIDEVTGGQVAAGMKTVRRADRAILPVLVRGLCAAAALPRIVWFRTSSRGAH
eukprot:CAMPEP_0185843960 /NCGR_PEP_ID=MMETSP1354-20130828/302_1 /TAXON_ID=708628 /ORGANISM="Erythrolobus madagascarensis, Strain CCMP3276" /LENGTH=424 /DNA_ID=CAMNT_0028543555 /DNA_START=42 /DNA_END=1317 /DNA_ORIENTATION=+